MLDPLNRLLKIEIAILVLLGSGIGIYTVVDAVKTSFQDSNSRKETIRHSTERSSQQDSASTNNNSENYSDSINNGSMN